MNEKTYRLRFDVVEEIYLPFKEKCRFYDIPMKDVILFMVEKFLDGDFDKELKLPVD
ncbi:MAG: hypothetical protein WC554_17480 [Clostridia bacterium]